MPDDAPFIRLFDGGVGADGDGGGEAVSGAAGLLQASNDKAMSNAIKSATIFFIVSILSGASIRQVKRDFDYPVALSVDDAAGIGGARHKVIAERDKLCVRVREQELAVRVIYLPGLRRGRV